MHNQHGFVSRENDCSVALMRFAAALLACSGTLLGCQGVEYKADGVGGEGELTGSTSEALACGNITFHTLQDFYWQQPLYSPDTHFCWLSEYGVRGAEHEGFGHLYVYNGYWTLDSRFNTRVSAYCIPQSCFFANNPGSVTWVSDRWEEWHLTGGIGFFQQHIWNGDAAAVLQGLEGKFRADSWAAVWQNSSSTAPSSLVSNNLDVYRAWGGTRASALFVGVPGGSHHPKIRSMTTLTKRNGCSLQHMMPADEGICFFTYLSGDFWGCLLYTSDAADE